MGIMRPEPREIVALANAIVKAEEDLAALRAKWDMYFPLEAPASVPTPPKKGGKTRQSNSLQGKLMDFFEKNPEMSFTAADVASIVHEDRKKVASNLAKLAYKKKIQTRHRGIYHFESPEPKAA